MDSDGLDGDKESALVNIVVTHMFCGDQSVVFQAVFQEREAWRILNKTIVGRNILRQREQAVEEQAKENVKWHPSTARRTTKATWCGKTRKEEGRGRGRGRGILRKKLVKLMRDSQSVSRVFATCPVAILSRFAWFCMCLRRPEGWLGVRGESIAGMRSRGIIKYVMKAWGHERYRERVCEYLKFWRGVMRAR